MLRIIILLTTQRYHNKTLAPDDQKYCDYESKKCFDADTESSINDPKNPSKNGVVVAVVIGILAIVIIVVAVLCLRNKIKKGKPAQADVTYVPGSSVTIENEINENRNGSQNTSEGLPDVSAYENETMETYGH